MLELATGLTGMGIYEAGSRGREADSQAAKDHRVEDSVDGEFIGAVREALGGAETGAGTAMTKEQEMAKFKREFWAEVASIKKTPTIDNLMITVTDAGWERMKEEPEYRQKMMDLIRRDTTGNFIRPVNCVIRIGAAEEEYLASSWSTECGSVFDKADEDSYVERRRRHKKYMKLLYEMERKRKLQMDKMQMKMYEKEMNFRHEAELKRIAGKDSPTPERRLPAMATAYDNSLLLDLLMFGGGFLK